VTPTILQVHSGGLSWLTGVTQSQLHFSASAVHFEQPQPPSVRIKPTFVVRIHLGYCLCTVPARVVRAASASRRRADAMDGAAGRGGRLRLLRLCALACSRVLDHLGEPLPALLQRIDPLISPKRARSSHRYLRAFWASIDCSRAPATLLSTSTARSKLTDPRLHPTVKLHPPSRRARRS
jgi:hypothetical protein